MGGEGSCVLGVREGGVCCEAEEVREQVAGDGFVGFVFGGYH